MHKQCVADLGKPEIRTCISTANALSTDREKCADSSSSLANALTVRIAPMLSSATAVASASAVCVKRESTRSLLPCHIATAMSGGNAPTTTSVSL